MSFLKGWRTRLFSGAVFILGLLEMADPTLISTALGLGERGHAVFFILFAMATYWLRQITTTPPGQK